MNRNPARLIFRSLSYGRTDTMSEMPEALKYAVIGAGNIGSALIGGMLKAGVCSAENLIATVKTPERAAEVSARYPIRVTPGGNLEATEGADVLIVAVKPATMPQVLHEIRWGLREGRMLISLAAAFPISLIEQVIARSTPVFRAMPNIPVLVEEGATAVAYNGSCRAEHFEIVERIFRAVGQVCFVEEHHMHAVTALSGSGPAYIYMVIEAMIAGGLKMGLPHNVATRLAEQTVLGAAKQVRDSMLHPAILKDQVITPGGVTISAVHELEKHGLRSMMITAIEAATRHSRHLESGVVERFERAEGSA
jgi:pyrroline-5-carboxylate reductase